MFIFTAQFQVMKVDGESCGPVAAEVGTVSEDPSSSTENAAQTWLRGASFKEVLGSDASHKVIRMLYQRILS